MNQLHLLFQAACLTCSTSPTRSSYQESAKCTADCTSNPGSSWTRPFVNHECLSVQSISWTCSSHLQSNTANVTLATIFFFFFGWEVTENIHKNTRNWFTAICCLVWHDEANFLVKYIYIFFCTENSHHSPKANSAMKRTMDNKTMKPAIHRIKTIHRKDTNMATTKALQEWISQIKFVKTTKLNQRHDADVLVSGLTGESATMTHARPGKSSPRSQERSEARPDSFGHKVQSYSHFKSRCLAEAV